MTEQNRARAVLYRQLMEVPHRKIEDAARAMMEVLPEDPDFVAKACVHWVIGGGTKIRDQQEAALATLLAAPPEFPEYREAGRVMALGSEVYETEPDGLPGLEPYRVFRLEQLLVNMKKSPRLRKNLMIDYVKFLEGHPTRFDGVVMRNRKAMHDAYVRNHVKPGPRAQAVLFDHEPPADSKLAILKRITNEEDGAERARLIVEYKIPYVVATSVLPKVGPEVGAALVGAMSPQEALNSRGWVERSGLLEIEVVKRLYLEKVSRATASVATAKHRKSAQGTRGDVQEAVQEAVEESVRKTERIEGSVLLLVDRSYSMERGIQVAKEFGARIAPLCPDRMIVAFNDYAVEVRPDGDDLLDHERAFKGITANGNTSMQAGLDYAWEHGFIPDKVVIITDGGENRGSYADQLYSVAPHAHTILIMVEENNWSHKPFHQTIEDKGLRVDRFEFTGDYYLFDQAVALLGGPAAKPMVQVIMETTLPRRAGWIP
jgi:hypothetical protein